ncbi:MAG: cell division protein FtsL [Gammaproteobacteria bacterium SHHR-1]|uniref:cell division protein FtsL n=1 Tax=Magnetovirga frankeli TaxID=947516 RepID=UPI0012935F9B|nr:cell division protein FtsL [gamma proteobacterium SS-5]
MSGHRQVIGVLVLFALVAASGLGVVYAKYSSRVLFVEQERLRKERDNLEIERGRLQLEQSTWASPARIEEEARQRLNMRMVKAEEIIVIE